MKNEFTLLIIDDDKGMHTMLRQYFRKLPYRLIFAEDGETGLNTALSQSVSLVLLDLKLPGMGGMDFLKKALSERPGLQVIIFTGHGSIRDAVNAVKLGAVDFLEKPLSPEIIRQKVRQVYSAWVLEYENRRLHGMLKGAFRYDAMIGESPSILRLKEMIARIASTDTSVLIIGESGTGKELVARAIHYHSRRHSETFMPVDCAAISETVMESELFGHVKGAFTNADQSTPGLLRAADKGTVFFDEVGEFAFKMQAKLLRTIQESTVRPVGSVKSVQVNIRIISATNRDLVSDVAKGRFREDLYYRLSGVTLMVPPLRERVDDIPRLARYFMDQLADAGAPARTISEEALSALCQYTWPGNVRELENVIRHAMAFCTGDTITPDDFPDNFCEGTMPGGGAAAAEPVLMVDHEVQAIRNALIKTFGSRRKAAKLLDISEATLYRRIKKYHILD